MPKNRKTRKDKKLTDQRKNTTVAFVQQSTRQNEKVEMTAQTDTTVKNKPTHLQHTTISTSEYNYIFQDLLKTVILTSSIIIAEIVIKLYTN